ncbi:hypothetical protein [Methylomonas sp. TEB]|uniref:hypothetical protein n=1 Tax=Methylomonas sp. TEB TaxID=3398229 RepID=UPI0039F53120
MTAPYFQYWGKAKPETDDGLAYHCVDVVVEWKLFKLLTGNDGSLKLRISTLSRQKLCITLNVSRFCQS